MRTLVTLMAHVKLNLHIPIFCIGICNVLCSCSTAALTVIFHGQLKWYYGPNLAHGPDFDTYDLEPPVPLLWSLSALSGCWLAAWMSAITWVLAWFCASEPIASTVLLCALSPCTQCNATRRNRRCLCNTHTHKHACFLKQMLRPVAYVRETGCQRWEELYVAKCE